MRRHKREKMVQDADLLLLEALIEWRRSEQVEKLSEWEIVSILMDKLGGQILGIAKYEIRYERHGDKDMEGGLAPSDEHISGDYPEEVKS